MKKLLIMLIVFGFCLNANALTVMEFLATKDEIQTVNKIGFKLLNDNRIPHRMTFSIAKNKHANAATKRINNEIVVTDTLIKTSDSLDEIAAVIAHEIAHGVDNRQGAFNGAFSFLGNAFNPKKYEYKSDKIAVDYLVKSGYNPLALITILNKISAQYRFDWNSTHPLTSRRMAEIYEYIYVKYPQYLVQNEFRENIYYQNFLLTSKENREKLQKKIESNSKRKVKYL